MAVLPTWVTMEADADADADADEEAGWQLAARTKSP